jgi:hypothetical protein
MAVTTKNILGTDSVSASRITLNDNVNTLKEALNDVLSIIDTSTGAIDNSTYGSTNTTKTKGITVTTTGITVQAGNTTLTLGDLVLDAGKISLQNIDLEYSLDGTSTILAIGASGMVMPMAGTTADFSAGTTGTMFYDTTANVMKYYTGSAWETIATV